MPLTLYRLYVLLEALLDPLPMHSGPKVANAGALIASSVLRASGALIEKSDCYTGRTSKLTLSHDLFSHASFVAEQCVSKMSKDSFNHSDPALQQLCDNGRQVRERGCLFSLRNEAWHEHLRPEESGREMSW